MTKLRKALIGVLAACTALSSSMALVACADDFPPFKNPTTAITPIDPVDPVDPDANKYTVQVKSVGGLPLNNVQVAFKQGGVTKMTTISRNGEIAVNLEVGEYDLEVDASTLPEGYYLPADASFKVSGENGTATVSLPSKVISSTVASSKKYVLGDIMHDFSYVNSDGETKQLSQLLETKKAVLINFFFIGCGPCRQEFPVIDKAYDRYKDDLEFVALSASDSATAIKNFQLQEGYSFDMGYDTSSLFSNFNVSNYPTSIMVDRYGAVAYISTGTETRESSWQSLFQRFTAANYQQVIENAGGDNSGETGTTEYVTPPADIETPDYSTVAGYLNGDGAVGKITGYSAPAGEEYEANWPWQLKNDASSTYLAASNTAAEPSYAIFNVEVSLNTGDILSYEYNVNCATGYDTLSVIMDSTDVLTEYAGDTQGWQRETGLYVANRDVSFTLSFVYRKLTDQGKPAVTNEFAGIRNFTVENVETIDTPFDFARSASVEGIKTSDLVLGEDGYYRISSDNSQFDGAILFVDLWNKSAWSTNRTGSGSFSPESEMNYDSSMYYFSFWELSDYQTVSGDNAVSYLYTDHDDYLNLCLNMQTFSKNGYVPVTQTLRTILEEFCEAFKNNRYHTGEYEDGEWIEMCYFYQHYNDDHAQDEQCYKYTDPVAGMAIFNANTAHVGTDNHVNIDTISSFNGGGRYFKFTPEVSGVYKFRTIANPALAPSMGVFSSPDGISVRNFKDFDTDLSYDNILNENCLGYAYVEAGETVYLQMRVFLGTTGEYDFAIEYVGETFDWLRTASTAAGFFIADLDENGNMTGASHYGAVNSALNEDDDCYYTYSVNSEGEFVWGSKLYIDFIHDNYCETRTLKQMIDDGVFDLSDFRLENYTQKMLEYYNEAMDSAADKDKCPAEGVIEANSEIVEIIATVLEVKGQDGDAFESGYWKSLACYYQHIGPNNN